MDNLENNDTSKTFSCLLDFQINSFALNNNGNKIIVAGNSYWEVLSIEDDRFVTMCNLNLRTFNLRVMDVEWSRMDETLAASCGSNGELQKLTILPTELKLENAYRFHDRTINKINFHPNDPYLLISGGQDGNIKLIDFRSNPIYNNNPVSVFQHQSDDRVTDLQINPAPSMNYQFTSGSESGFVYIWDYRMPNRYEKRYNLLRGIVHLDWHPEEKNWLAVAKSDRQISVLDTTSDSTRSNQLYSITNSESISNIKWRPKRKMQIGACMGGANYHHLYVWDLKRPYVPYASFDTIINKADNFLWKNGPNCIIASTKVQNNRSKLYNTYISEAQKPADYSTLVTVEMDKTGSIAFAVGVKEQIKTDSKVDIDTISVCSDTDNEKFKINQSLLYFDKSERLAKSNWFLHSATNYKFNNGTFEELCEHNGKVALDYGRIDDYKNWMILKTLYKENDKYDIKEENSSKSSSSLSNSKQIQSSNKLTSNENNSTIQIPFAQVTANTSSSSEESVEDSPSSSEIVSVDSPILESNGNPINLEANTNSNGLKHSKENVDKHANYRQNENFFVNTNSDLNILSHLEIQDEHNLVNNSHLTKFDDEDDYSMLPKDIVDFNNFDDIYDLFFKNEREIEHYGGGDQDDHHFHNYPNLQTNFKSQSDLTSSVIQTSKQIEPKDMKNSLNTNNNTSGDIEMNRINELNNCFENHLGFDDVIKMNFDDSFCQLLFNYIDEQNDLVTAIFMYLVATLNEKIDKNKIDSNYLDEWFVQYIELLAKFELWNQRIEIIKVYQTDAIRNLTQKTLVYNSMCGFCKRTIQKNTLICNYCKKNAFLCSFCHLPVKRLYAWCHACCHGGHLNHMTKWFKTNTNCPTGCGCVCSPNYNQNEQNLTQ